MIFSSVTFLFLFLPPVLLLYYIVPVKLKNFILLAASLIFYAWGEPIYVILMLYSILLNYSMGLLMDRVPKMKTEILVFTVFVNLLLLGFFKYYGFLMENVNAIFHLNLPIRRLALPIGISFYTFQALSYIIDLYRGKFPVQKNIVRFATYITMFPQLIAGPIVRYEDVERQLEKRTLSLPRFGKGAVRFIIGLAKKVLLANLTGAVFEQIAAQAGSVSTLGAWIGALAYTFQIYFDFSGYSDMAISLGDMLGFRFSENFNSPYAAESVTDFWRRWHISLGTWFREYVYIPLGGNRVSVIKHIRNILVVWMLTGLWHGASWNFVIWGLYYGILLLLEKYVFLKWKIPTFIRRIFTLLFVIVGWVIFSAESLPQILTTLQAMFGFAPKGFADSTALYVLKSSWILLAAAAFFSLPILKKPLAAFKKSHANALYYTCAALLLVIVFTVSVAFLVTENYNPFLYFRF
ncbi:MAG: MBOAT family protein [Lachnospiraceae bacterium]|nr:MBOAT family protein [Lachnospiraceae bacterium]